MCSLDEIHQYHSFILDGLEKINHEPLLPHALRRQLDVIATNLVDQSISLIRDFPREQPNYEAMLAEILKSKLLTQLIPCIVFNLEFGIHKCDVSDLSVDTKDALREVTTYLEKIIEIRDKIGATSVNNFNGKLVPGINKREDSISDFWVRKNMSMQAADPEYNKRRSQVYTKLRQDISDAIAPQGDIFDVDFLGSKYPIPTDIPFTGKPFLPKDQERA